jgi:hypothetical protein
MDLSRGLGDVYKRQRLKKVSAKKWLRNSWLRRQR